MSLSDTFPSMLSHFSLLFHLYLYDIWSFCNNMFIWYLLWECLSLSSPKPNSSGNNLSGFSTNSEANSSKFGEYQKKAFHGYGIQRDFLRKLTFISDILMRFKIGIILMEHMSCITIRSDDSHHGIQQNNTMVSRKETIKFTKKDYFYFKEFILRKTILVLSIFS